MKEGHSTEDSGLSRTKIAVVISAYNEEATIRDVVSRALAQIRHVIVVDDGSSDRTSERLAGLAIEFLRNEQNVGKAASLTRGFAAALAAGAEAVVTLDGDGQHAPEDIPQLIAAHERHPACIVIGARDRGQRRTRASRYFANRLADFWIGWACGQFIADSQSGFRLYPAEVLRGVEISPRESFVFESEVLIEAAWRGHRSVAAAVRMHVDVRPSHFRPLRDISRITRMVGWRLLSRGFCLRGLINMFRESSLQRRQSRSIRAFGR